MSDPLDALLAATDFRCKPVEWPTKVSAPADKVAAAKLPSFTIFEVYGPCLAHPTRDFDRDDLPQYFILAGHGASWLVDTQGYSYARYVALIG